MRVHVVIDRLGHGGAEMLLGDLAAVAGGAGLELDVTSLAAVGDEPAAQRLRGLGVEPVAVPVSGLLSPPAVRALRERLLVRRPDVVHTHLDYADVLGGWAARGLGLPSVSTLHVMRWEADSLRDRARLQVFGRVRRRTAGRVIAVSDAARDAYLRHRWDRPDRVVTVHNGIARGPRPGAGTSVRAGLGIAADAPVVTMLSVLRPGKGHEVALAAAARLRDSFPGLRLLIAGEGPSAAALRELAAPLGASVIFAGHRDDVMEVLDATDVLLHPSEFDAFPTGLLEAMAAGVPVVATRVGGIREIVEDGETGLLLAAPADAAQLAAAVGSLLADAQRSARLGAAAQAAFAERFTAERWVQRLAEIYRELLGPG